MWTSKRFTSNFLLDSSKNLSTFYIESEFIHKLYFYYINKGYKNIITSQIVNILINIFTVFFVIFLFNCIDYAKVLSIKEEAELGDVIFMNNFFNLSIFIWIQLIIFLIIIFCKILSVIDDIFSFKTTQDFYNNTLKILDSELNASTWESILNKLRKHYRNNDIDAYFISNKIMTKDNYMIGMIDRKIIDTTYFTTLLEWNLMYCIVFYIFDENYKVKKNLTSDRNLHVNKIKTRLRSVSMVNFLLMPFIIIFLIFYNLFEYCEKFYNSPKLINTRAFTLEAQLKFRYYNEIQHHFMERMELAKDAANEYMNQFHSKITETISKLVIFILSAIFTILILLSILNENVLIYLHVTPNKTVLWYLGIIATIITITKNFTTKKTVFYPRDKMIELRKIVRYLPEEFETSKDSHKIKIQFSEYFQYKIILLLKEIIYTLFVPFKLFEISFDVDKIVVFLQENTLRHNKIGRTFKLSLFDNILGLDNYRGDNKTVQSFHNFKELYYEWYEDTQSMQASINIV